MKQVRRSVAFLSFISMCALLPAAAAGDIELLHEFAGGSADGKLPQAAVTLDGTTLYGTTFDGGAADRGTIFKMNADGTGFQVLHEFAGGSDDGDGPMAPLIRDGTTLYGTAADGGIFNGGVVFKIEADGSGYQVLHKFVTSTGSSPTAPLILDGTTLYGTAKFGGLVPGGSGSVFKINTDGSGFQVLHLFSSDDSNGFQPQGGLTRVGSMLYGTAGGGPDVGVIYKLNTDGTEYQHLHEFTGSPDDGTSPRASLIYDGTMLYGTTFRGGATGDGTIFKINPDGSGYEIIHEFSGVDGREIPASLTLNGTTLYGVAQRGGSGAFPDRGTVFTLDTNGDGFRVLHHFADLPGVWQPWGSLVLDGSTLYGTTQRGGAFDGGTVFALTVPEPSTAALAVVTAVVLTAWSCRRRLRR